MPTDDLTRRAIIAAHDAECGDRQCEGIHMPGLSRREAAIVEAWAADRDDYQGRYETSHDARMHAEDRLDDMTRETRKSRAAAAKAATKAERAEGALSDVRSWCGEWAADQWAARAILDRIGWPNGEEATS